MTNVFKRAVLLCLAGVMLLSLCSCAMSEQERAVADYVESVEKLVESEMSTESYTCEIEARKTALVYKYTLLGVDNIPEDKKADIEEMATSLDESALSWLEEIKAEVPEVESVIYEYYEEDGDLIVSREFGKAE